MLNKYPAWKNILILIVVILGFLYSLPNLYPDDPALQISHELTELSQGDMPVITSALEAAEVDFFGEEIDTESIRIRLNTLDDQLRAKTAIEDALGESYIVALNLAPTTPGWLQAIGAGKMNLGLDLQGGVHFLMEVDMDAAIIRRMEDNLSNVRTILREQRIRSRGLNLMSNSHLEVRFANDEDRSQARSEMVTIFPELQMQSREAEGVFILDMRMTPATALQIQTDTLQANRTTLLNRVDTLGVSEPTVQQQGSDRIVVELPGMQDPAQAIRILQRIATLEIHLESELGASSLSYETYDYEGIPVNVDNSVVLQGDSISNAVYQLDQNSQPSVVLSLDAQGGNQMNRATRDNVGRRMDILLIETKSRTITSINEDGEEVEDIEFYEEKELIMHATIQQALGRQFSITGLTPREASDLAPLIRSGSLAAPMTIVEQSVIGPSMGQENLDQGLLGVQVASGLVVLFMLFYYRTFGMAANAALIMNILMIVAVMSSIIPATLTLPGIVGIVLTVGMAVDANVLIFTRIREELGAGAPPQQAIDAGYNRAFTTIIDANLTTFLVAAVLYTIGTGPVRGFAITLMIGIITSMFTAIIGTRAIVNLIYGGKSGKTLSIGSYRKNIKQDGLNIAAGK
ncbi:MAG: protein translocase subunit SecD [Pseudomonadales bacterium]|jgi:preprotein translocase subunit SecD|tara:strand:+ start:1763 stop:3658 length:1896 start_codon:yes stop_codon:yes gene_type:complete